MFATFKTEVRAVVADAFDLAIEFATLGEYGLPASDDAAAPDVRYPSFEGLPVRGGSCSVTADDRLRRAASARRERRGAAGGAAAATATASRVRRDSPERRTAPRRVASARP